MSIAKVSPILMNLIAGFILTATAQTALSSQLTKPEPASGPLRVHPDNPRYFTDGTRHRDGSLKAVFLTGSHTWNNFQHNGVYPAVEFDEYLSFLERHHHNFIRLWVWEQGGWDPWAKNHVPVGPLAYRRTGPGKALDGLPKYDLNRFNDAYFTRLRSRVQRAGQRGIWVSVMLFEGWSVEQKGQVGNPWKGHPFNQANNINGVNGDLNNDGQGPEIHSLNAPKRILELQQAYVRRVIDTLNDLGNVLYEIGNEMHTGSVQWQYRMIDYIHAYEEEKPKQHPVGMTGAPIDNAALFSSPAEWISPTGSDGYNTDPPPANGRKVIVSDVDHVWPRNFPQWTWISFVRGLNTAFMDLYGAVKIGDRDVDSFSFVGDWVAQHEETRQQMGVTRKLAERMHLAAMTPQPKLASIGYCLANPAGQSAAFVVYLPEGGPVTVDLSATEGRLMVEWIHPQTGEIQAGEPVIGGGPLKLEAPFAGEAVLYLRAKESNTPNP
jgi:hypothetical protein